MANFVFCVAHFCEIHGPVTILCTQKQEFKVSASNTSHALCESCSFDLPLGVSSLVTHCEEDTVQTQSNGNGNGNANASGKGSRDGSRNRSGSLNGNGSGSGNLNGQLKPVPSNNPIPSTLSKLLNGDTHGQETATSFPVKGFSAGKLTYASTLYPQSEKIYTCLTKLVMKCLSVELAEPLKPVFFGNTNTGYCLSRIFRIADLHARGGERKYALMVVSDSESALLSNWDVALGYIAEIISQLQSKVEALMEQKKLDGTDNGRFMRRAKTIPRSLVQLTGDPDIFMKLHLCGTELLRCMSIP